MTGKQIVFAILRGVPQLKTHGKILAVTLIGFTPAKADFLLSHVKIFTNRRRVILLKFAYNQRCA